MLRSYRSRRGAGRPAPRGRQLLPRCDAWAGGLAGHGCGTGFPGGLPVLRLCPAAPRARRSVAGLDRERGVVPSQVLCVGVCGPPAPAPRTGWSLVCAELRPRARRGQVLVSFAGGRCRTAPRPCWECPWQDSLFAAAGHSGLPTSRLRAPARATPLQLPAHPASGGRRGPEPVAPQPAPSAGQERSVLTADTGARAGGQGSSAALFRITATWVRGHCRATLGPGLRAGPRAQGGPCADGRLRGEAGRAVAGRRPTRADGPGRACRGAGLRTGQVPGQSVRVRPSHQGGPWPRRHLVVCACR